MKNPKNRHSAEVLKNRIQTYATDALNSQFKIHFYEQTNKRAWI